MPVSSPSAAPPPKKKPKGASFWVSLFAVLLTALVFLPATVVLSVCMIPTLVSAIIDPQPQKTAWLTVGAMNLAGAVPVLIDLWDAGHTLDVAFRLVFQPTSILIAYGAAAAGILIHNNVTPMVAGLIIKKNEHRLRDIDKRQKELIRKWGEGVMGDTRPD